MIKTPNNPHGLEYFSRNPKLKAPGVDYPWTKEEVEEFIKCKKDPIYFIENYVKIIDVTGKVIIPELYEYQKKIIKSYLNNKLSITKQPRQSGKTLTVVMLFNWFLIFEPNRVSYILANKADVAKKILAQVKFSYEQLPFFLQQGVVSWNKTFIEFENNSKLFTAATAASGIRGETVTGILLWDEAAHVADTIAPEFFTSVYPTVSQPGSKAKFIITSTPKGFNFFYKIWNDSEQGKMNFKTFTIHWAEVPGRDQAWADNELKILGDQLFAQEVLVDFLGSSNALISADSIRRLSASQPVKFNDSLSVYETPVKDNKYMIVCDPSRGTGNDDSAFVVFNITNYPITIAARFKDNKISPTALPMVLYNVATSYNMADVLIEINDNGEQVSTILWQDLEYENIILFDMFSKQPKSGIRTTKSVKAKGCATLKELVENQKLLINDVDIILQITNFVQKKSSFEADKGYHDDLVMCLVLFAWYSTTLDFKNLFDVDLRSQLMKAKEQWVEDYMTPVGFYVDGARDEEIDHSELIVQGNPDEVHLL